MEKIRLIAICHFGVEAVLKREIFDLGYEVCQTEDGRITFETDIQGIAYANIFLRTAERIMVEAGRFHAETFDELYEGVKAIDWKRFIPKDGKFWVKKAASVRSKLFSPTDIQKIVKKAIVDNLKDIYHTSWFMEDGAEYPLRVFINKDDVVLGIDTSGESLHKRGYRVHTTAAPISETLAASLIKLTPWRGDRILVDPFCGSGTFPIEAALMAINKAPGMDRHFTAEQWENIVEKKVWKDAFLEAESLIKKGTSTDIQGYDIDHDAVEMARGNARLAGVSELIHFQARDVGKLSHSKKYGFVITNPPYGERLDDEETVKELYEVLGDRIRALDCWSAYVITSNENLEKYMGIKAAKNRKIYNGMIKTYFYQFPGPKPPKRTRAYKDN